MKVGILLEYNADINGNGHYPPIFAACDYGDEEMVNYLLDNHANCLIRFNASENNKVHD